MMQAWLDGLKSGAEVVPLHGKGLNEDKRTRSVMHIGKAIVVCAFAGVITTGQAWADCQPELVVTDNNRPGWKLTVQWPKIEKRQFRLFDPKAAIDFQCELSHWSSTSSAEKLGVGCVTASDDAFLVLLPSPRTQSDSDTTQAISFFFGKSVYSVDRFVGKIVCQGGNR